MNIKKIVLGLTLVAVIGFTVPVFSQTSVGNGRATTAGSGFGDIAVPLKDGIICKGKISTSFTESRGKVIKIPCIQGTETVGEIEIRMKRTKE